MKKKEAAFRYSTRLAKYKSLWGENVVVRWEGAFKQSSSSNQDDSGESMFWQHLAIVRLQTRKWPLSLEWQDAISRVMNRETETKRVTERRRNGSTVLGHFKHLQ